MKTFMISLNTFDKIKKFANMTYNQDYEMDLISGRYVVDAKSILGIFSLDLSKPVELIIYSDKFGTDACPEEFKEFMAS